MQAKLSLNSLFDLLFKSYGHQGWWPILLARLSKQEQHKLLNGYHPGDYKYPKNKEQILEICLGAVLTQNTNWKNVILALQSLKRSKMFSYESILHTEVEKIALAIKSAGYYNQKAQTIRRLVTFLQKIYFPRTKNVETSILRNELLEIKGIGPETADCILLYAFHRCSFVVDAYTRRILTALDIIDVDFTYDQIKERFEETLVEDLGVFQEYHALLVEHGKNHYSKKPYGINDQLLNPKL